MNQGETSIVIRAGKKEDVPAIMSLIHDLALFEKSPESVLISEAELLRDGFEENPLYAVLVAEIDMQVVGMALTYYCYSTWKGKYLYLEDLIVKEDFRQRGVGSKLFESLIAKVKSEGLRQMGWQVLDWNEPAIKFYEKYKATLDPEWLNGRFYFV